MRFLEFLSEAIIYALVIFSPIPYGSVEGLWRFLLISAIALTGILLSIKLFLNKDREIILYKAYKLFLVIICAVLITAVFSPRPSTSLRSWIFLTGIGLLPLIVINNFKTKEKLKRLIFVLFISGFLLSIYAITNVVISATLPGEHFRLTFTSTFYNHNHFAGFLEIILPFAISGLLFYRKGDRHFKYILLSVFFFATLLLTFSRGGIVSFIIAFLIVILLYLNNLKIFFPTALVSSFMLYLFFSLKSVLGKIFSFEEITFSGHSRAILWKSGLMSILDKPLIGWGPGNFEIAYLKHRDSIDGIVNYAHNDFIQAFVELGIPVAFTLIIILTWFFFSGIKDIKKRHNPFYYYLGASSTFAIISITLHEFVDFNLRIPAISIYFAIIFSIFILATFAERKSDYNNELIEKYTLTGSRSKIIFLTLLSVVILISSLGIVRNELKYKIAENQYRNGEIETQNKELETIENSFFKSAKYYNLDCRILNTRASIENSPILLEKAIKKCILATRLDNFNPFYALDTAEILKKSGRINEALSFYRTASEIDPENAYFKSILIDELIGANNHEEAKNLSIDFINKHPEKTIKILTVLKNDKRLLKNFILYLNEGKQETNENILNFLYINNLSEDYLELFYKLYLNKFKFSKQIFYNIAADYLIKSNKYDDAEKILYSGIELFPEVPDAYLRQMNLLFFLKKYDEVLKLGDMAEKKMDLTDVYYYRALVYREKGEFALALKNAKLCIGRNADNNNYRYLLYDIYMRMGMEYEAMQALGDPNRYTSRDVHLMHLRASLFEKWDKLDEAIREYKKILSFQPENQFAIKKLIELEEKNK